MTTRAQRAARRGGNKAGGSKKGAAAAAAAAASPTALAASFADLPDELALRIFSHLDLHTRLGVVALVCTRWRQLTLSPPLLRTIEARIRGSPARTLSQAATSFCDWFYDWAAPHTQRLNVVLPFDYGPYEANFNDIVLAMDELSRTLSAASADRGCRLQDLRIAHCFQDHDWDVPDDGWGLTSLRRLQIHMPKGCLGFSCFPDSFPLLTDLELLGFMDLGTFDPKPLPAGLTHLRLSLPADFWAAGPPEEMQNLTALRSLVMHDCSWEAASYDELLLPLRTGLERLALVKCREVPANLGALTGLRLLHLSCTPQHQNYDDTELLADELPKLTQLTGLIINHNERTWERARLAAAISDLPLQHLSMLGSDPSHGEPPLALPPPGRWQAQLRELVLPAATAAAALPQLAAASRLESLTLLHLCSVPVEQQEAVLAFAGCHPSLQRLRLDASGPHLSAATFDAVSSALRANGALRLLPGLSSGDAGRLAEEAWQACSGGGEWEPRAL